MRTLYDIKQLAYHRSISDVVTGVHPTLNYDNYKNSFFIHSMWGDYEPVERSYWITTNRNYERMRNYR